MVKHTPEPERLFKGSQHHSVESYLTFSATIRINKFYCLGGLRSKFLVECGVTFRHTYTQYVLNAGGDDNARHNENNTPECYDLLCIYDWMIFGQTPIYNTICVLFFNDYYSE